MHGKEGGNSMDKVINAIITSVIKKTKRELTPVVQALFDSRGSAGISAAESLISTIVCRLAHESTVDETVKFLMAHDVSPVCYDQIEQITSAIATKCLVEICAVNEAISEERRGVAPRQILKDIKKRMKEKSYCIDCMPRPIDPNREEDIPDDDPINGRYVNREHQELLHRYDAANTEKEKNELHKQSIAICKKEVKKSNPLALFYLGVAYLNGSNVKKDVQKGRRLLEQAHELGVKRAMSFLVSYFEDYRGA